jgi:hypothetical protein
MAAEKKQKKRLKGKQQTPKKQKAPERPVIGSSSTWKEEELERFNVRRGAAVDVKNLIPEKWFQFDNLERYQSGIIS